MFEHLDSPDPPSYSAATQAQVRLRAARFRRRRRAVRYPVAGVSILVLAVFTVFTLRAGRPASVRVVTGPQPLVQTDQSSIQAPPTTSVPLVAPSRRVGTVLLTDLNSPIVELTTSGLYVADEPAGTSGDRLRRVNPTTGAVEAQVALPGQIDHRHPLVEANNELWTLVSSSDGHSAQLLGLSPTTLRVSHSLHLPAGGPAPAAAGGWLWILGDHRLLKIAARTDILAATVPLPDSGVTDIGSDPSHSLLVATTFGGTVIKLNPSTGGVLGRYTSSLGDGTGLVGVTKNQAFISAGVGMNSGFYTVDLRTGQFGSLNGGGNNPTLVISGDRLLEDSPYNFSKESDYCALTQTGRPIARLPTNASNQAGYPVAFAHKTLFYVAYAENNQTETLERVDFSECG